MFDIAIQTIALLAVAAFIAGFVDSIAGGGGLITVPALLLAGLSPVEALGTNKIQGLFGAASATLTYASKGQVQPRRQVRPAVMAFLGSALGAMATTVIPGAWLSVALPIVLVLIAIFFAFKPNMNDVDKHERLSPRLFGLTMAPLVGFYDGLFGPGAGSFYMLAFVTLAGFGVLKATAHTKLVNFASNLGGFTVFAAVGVIYWKIGLLMGAAQFLGARTGALLAIRNGASMIKPLLVLMCLALAMKLLSDPTNPLRVLAGI